MSALLAIVGTLALCVALIIFCAEGDNRDWRDEWCVPECRAAHDQGEPCADCPARRAAHRAAQCGKTTNYPSPRFAGLETRQERARGASTHE